MASLPNEMTQLVLSKLTLNELAVCSRVCKLWRNLSRNESLLDHKIAEKFAFGKRLWEKHYGKVGDVPKLPGGIYKLLTSPCPIWKNKKVYQTHFLFLIPKRVTNEPLTLKIFEKLVLSPKTGRKVQFKKLACFIRLAIEDTCQGKSCWALATKRILRISKADGQNKKIAEIMEKTEYKVPTVLQAAILNFAGYTFTGKRFYHSKRDVSYSLTKDVLFGQPLIFGAFDEQGAVVDYASNTPEIGLGLIKILSTE